MLMYFLQFLGSFGVGVCFGHLIREQGRKAGLEEGLRMRQILERRIGALEDLLGDREQVSLEDIKARLIEEERRNGTNHI